MLMPMNIMIVLLPSSAACCAQPVVERSQGDNGFDNGFLTQELISSGIERTHFPFS